jgi:hypothetical protein
MKKIVILVAVTMVMAIAAGCVTTIPQKNIPAVVKPKAC